MKAILLLQSLVKQAGSLILGMGHSGSPAFVVLSNKEKAAKDGLVRQPTPPQCVRDDFLGKTSLKAILHWFLGGSTQWLSMGNAEEPVSWCHHTFGGTIWQYTELCGKSESGILN